MKIIARSGDVIVANDEDHFLLWHFSSARGVRTDLDVSQSGFEVHYRNGAFLVTSDAATYILPIPLAHDWPDTRTQPLPLQLPADIPFVSARRLHKADDRVDALALAHTLECDSLAAPLFCGQSKLWPFSV